MAQKAPVRLSPLSNMDRIVDTVNAIVDRDKGRSWDPVVWTPDTASYGLTLDNVQGNHLNLGTGKMLVQDAGLTVAMPTLINSALTVGSVLSATDTGDIAALGGISVGTYTNPDVGDGAFSGGIAVGTYTNPSAGQILGTGGLSIGTYVNATAGQGFFSDAVRMPKLNVATTSSVSDSGDAWISGGLSVGTYNNPLTGQILASQDVTAVLFVSTVATGTAPVQVTSTTKCPNLNADLLDGLDSTAFLAASGGTVSGGTTFSALITANGGIEIGGGTAAAGRITSSATVGMQVRGKVGSALDFLLTRASDGSSILSVDTGTVDVQLFGNTQCGSPVGGKKGAGTINAIGVYDDNTLLTDWVADLWADGRVLPEDEAEHGDAHLWSIDETEAFMREHRHLPSLPGRAAWNADGSRSLGQMVTHLWETIERQQLHIFDLNRRLAHLEARAA